MKKLLITVILTGIFWPGTGFAEKSNVFPGNTGMSFNAGLRYSMNDLGADLNINLCFKDRYEVGIVFSDRDFGYQTGVKLLKTWKYAIFTFGVQGGINYGSAVLDRMVTWSENNERFIGAIGYKHSLSSYAGINAGIELPFGLGIRMNIGSDYILVHSEKANLTGTNPPEIETRDEKKFVSFGLEAYLRF